MLFDTHAHLNDEAFDADRDQLLETFHDAGVGWVLNAGCSLESSYASIALAEKYDWIYASVGSHPDIADEGNDEVLEPSVPKWLWRRNLTCRSLSMSGMPMRTAWPSLRSFPM